MKRPRINRVGIIILFTILTLPGVRFAPHDGRPSTSYLVENVAEAAWAEWEPPTVIMVDEALKLIQSFQSRPTVEVDEEIVFTTVTTRDKQGRFLDWTLAGAYYKPRQGKVQAGGKRMAMVAFPGGTGNHLSLGQYRDLAARGIPVLVIGPIGGYNFKDPTKKGGWSGPAATRPPQFNEKLIFQEGKDYTVENRTVIGGFYSSEQKFMIPVPGSLFESYMVYWPIGHYAAARKLINEIFPPTDYGPRISSAHSTGGALAWPMISDPTMNLDIFNVAAEPFGGVYGVGVDPEKKVFQWVYDLRWSRVRDEDNIPYLKKQYGEDWPKYVSQQRLEEGKKWSWMIKPGTTDGILWGRDWTPLAQMAGIDPAKYNDLNWPVSNGYRPKMIDVHFANDIWNTLERYSNGWSAALKKASSAYTISWFLDVDSAGTKAVGLGHDYTYPVIYRDQVLKGGLWPAAAELFMQAKEKGFYLR